MERPNIAKTIVGMVAFTIVSFLFLVILVFASNWDIENNLPAEPPKGYVSVAAEVEKIRWDFSDFVTDVRFDCNGATITKSLDGNALVEKGSSITIYYNPKTGKILYDLATIKEIIDHLNSQDTGKVLIVLLVMYTISMAACIVGLIQNRKDNRIIGVITDITEAKTGAESLSPNARKVLSAFSSGNALPRFIVTCTFTSPETGDTITAKGVNDKPLKVTVGDNVTVIYNKMNPEASFVDVDGVM